MRKWMRAAAALVSAVMLSVSSAGLAEDMLSILDSMTDYVGSAVAAEQATSLPDLVDAFSGKTVTVTVGKSKVKVHERFKEAMDAYEAFFDEYIEVMQTMDMTRYMSFMTRYAEVMEALDTIDDMDLSDGDTAYYLEVMTRIEEKLLNAM